MRPADHYMVMLFACAPVPTNYAMPPCVPSTSIEASSIQLYSGESAPHPASCCMRLWTADPLATSWALQLSCASVGSGAAFSTDAPYDQYRTVRCQINGLDDIALGWYGLQVGHQNSPGRNQARYQTQGQCTVARQGSAGVTQHDTGSVQQSMMQRTFSAAAACPPP